MTSATQEKLTELYGVYNGTIKLLIAEIEAKTQKFPIELFNEIRSYNDHIARCYIPGSTQAIHDTELRKAESHIIRITLDCYKFLNVIYHQKLKNFLKKDTRFVDLAYVDSGKFYPQLMQLKKEAETLSADARRNESLDKSVSLEKWQAMYNKYTEIFEFIDSNNDNICWARKKFFKNKLVTIGIWVLTILAAWILGHFTFPALKKSNDTAPPRQEVVSPLPD